jgi:hypothetical protein
VTFLSFLTSLRVESFVLCHINQSCAYLGPTGHKMGEKFKSLFPAVMDKQECDRCAHTLAVLFGFRAFFILIGTCVINEFELTHRFGYEEKSHIFNFEI